MAENIARVTAILTDPGASSATEDPELCDVPIDRQPPLPCDICTPNYHDNTFWSSGAANWNATAGRWEPIAPLEEYTLVTVGAWADDFRPAQMVITLIAPDNAGDVPFFVEVVLESEDFVTVGYGATTFNSAQDLITLEIDLDFGELDPSDSGIAQLTINVAGLIQGPYIQCIDFVGTWVNLPRGGNDISGAPISVNSQGAASAIVNRIQVTTGEFTNVTFDISLGPSDLVNLDASTDIRTLEGRLEVTDNGTGHSGGLVSSLTGDFGGAASTGPTVNGFTFPNLRQREAPAQSIEIPQNHTYVGQVQVVGSREAHRFFITYLILGDGGGPAGDASATAFSNLTATPVSWS